MLHLCVSHRLDLLNRIGYAGGKNPVYAKSLPGEVYHLLAQEQDRTLCGLSVVPIIIDRPVRASELHLTTKEPAEKICEACARQGEAGKPSH